jgi:hypothetical protein
MVKEINGGRYREGGLQSGLATAQDFEDMAKAWEEWTEQDSSSLAMIQGQIIIQK